MTAFLLAAAMIVPAGQTFTCTPVRVWDGDGPVWCEEGPRVRLAGIAAREMDGTCRDNQPCPDAEPRKARDALVDLVGIPFNRTAAWCVSPLSGDVSCAMVAGGWALRWPVYWQGHRCDR
jgi:endonuclease YncB( thermonuclease family)